MKSRPRVVHCVGLGFLLACSPTPESTITAPADTNKPSAEVPEHLASTIDAWKQVVFRNLKSAAAESRIGGKRQVRWTDAERAELEMMRTQARDTITHASAQDRPWLLAVYLAIFAFYGIGAEWADTIVDIPPEHPVWSGEHAWGLFDALEETSDPARLRAYIHAAAAVHEAALIDAQSVYLHVEDADRARDWPRAHELYARLDAIPIPHGTSPIAASALLDVSGLLDPDRPLRADTQVPSYCGPAILGPHAGTRVCLDEQFPHETPTLIIGWATWCGPCNEQLPTIIELVRDRPLRVIAISYDEDAELAREHLHAQGVDSWTVLLPRAERPLPADAMSLDWRAIPFLAVVDEQGKVEAGPPHLDAETLPSAIGP
jgi:thiol-disulfide isomerase/thioredoxin